MRPELTVLHVRGDTADRIGYGRMGVKLVDALSGAGVDIYNAIERPAHIKQEFTDHLPNTRKGQTNTIMWVSTPGHTRGWFTGQHAVLSTMWEATRLPESFREQLHCFDTIVVPSDQNAELFADYHPNVHTAYLGVDPADWFFVEREAPAREFRFLVGGSGPRKGTDLVFKAFHRVFKTWPKDGPVPTLVMKNPKGEDFYGDRVQMVTGKISGEDERALYASAHCYVQPSRGEGFGLQPLQALAQGCPTILTDAHGQASFAHLGYGLDSTLVESGYFVYGDAGQWWEPDFDELCEYMEYVYFNYDAACAKGKDAAVVVAERFTWANTAQRYLDILGDQLTVPYKGDGSWFAPSHKLYPVVLTRDWRTEVAGNSYLFRKGQQYHETADVKRLLFEAGLLDPVCLEGPGEDTGLLPEELATLGAYSASHEWCDHCGQKVGSGVTRADTIMAGM